MQSRGVGPEPAYMLIGSRVQGLLKFSILKPMMYIQCVSVTDAFLGLPNRSRPNARHDKSIDRFGVSLVIQRTSLVLRWQLTVPLQSSFPGSVGHQKLKRHFVQPDFASGPGIGARTRDGCIQTPTPCQPSGSDARHMVTTDGIGYQSTT